MYSPKHLACAAAIGAAVVVAACDSDRDVFGPNPPSGGEIFRSYVAIGNSITAGWQSGGINDSTQQADQRFFVSHSCLISRVRP